MNDKLTITLNIAGRPCVLTIEREEEEEIRKAAQLINSKSAKYSEKDATADPVDFLAVTALQFTVKMLEAERRNDVEPVLDEVKKISSRLDEVVKDKKKKEFFEKEIDIPALFRI